jgi:hypothetical protein
MAKSANYPLRWSQSVMRVARETTEREGVSLNQFIAGAVAEKLAALRTEDLLKERARRADWWPGDPRPSRDRATTGRRRAAGGAISHMGPRWHACPRG